MKNGLAKDICYKDDYANEFIFKGHEKDINCYSIENMYLKNICFRIGLRPHMTTFITTNSSEISFENFLEECKIYDDYVGLHCAYLKAAELAKIDLEEAKKICDNFDDKKLKSECEFYIINSVSMGIEEFSKEDIDSVMYFCKDISHPSWKSECYFELADELVLAGNAEYLQEISDACRESYLAYDYSCFDHVTYLMDIESTEEYCKIVDYVGKPRCYINLCKKYAKQDMNYSFAFSDNINNIPKEFRGNCFEGLGASFQREYDNIMRGINVCKNNVPDEFREYCFEGLFISMGWDIAKSEGIEICKNNVPKNFIGNCFRGLSFSKFDMDILEGIRMCSNDVPEEFKEYCFQGLGYFFGPTSEVDFVIDKCNNVPEEFKEYCFQGLGYSTTDSKDLDFGTARCSAVTEKFKKSCFEGLSDYIIYEYRYNKSMVTKKCNELPEEHIQYCVEKNE